MVVFWPRVVPRSDEPVVRELARRVQRRLGEVVAKAAPKRPLDVRPEPERVCPRDGCEAMTVGVVLTVREGGCAVVALVAEPGQSPSRLVPWGGTVDLKAEQSAFREPPESQIVIKDMVPCDELFAQLTSNEESVLKAIAGVAPPGQP